MQILSIGTSVHSDLLMERLQKECAEYERKQIPLTVKKERYAKYDYLFLDIEEKQDVSGNLLPDIDEIKDRVKDILKKFLICYFEPIYIKKEMEEEYSYLDHREKNKVYQYLLKYKKEKIYQEEIAEILEEKLKTYLDWNNEILLDGFMRFRLKPYQEIMKETLKKALEDFFMEQEYREFLALLKHFVAIQEAKLECVHLVFDEKGLFRLYDDRYHKIGLEYVEEGLLTDDLSIRHYDLLISSLINIAPKKLVIHRIGNLSFLQEESYKEILETIEGIFQDSLEICFGCEFCKTILIKNLKN